MPNSFKTRLKGLPMVSKLVMVGSFLAIVGALLPWYKDIDKFGRGDMFLGINGPLYLAGLIVLFSGIACFSLIAMRLAGKAVPKLPVEEDKFYFIASLISASMLLLSISVFFHNKFGISLVDKSLGIGVYLGIIGTFLVLVSSVRALRNADVNFDVKGKVEPLIEINDEHRVTQKLEPENVDEVKSAVQDSVEEFTNDIK